MEGQGEEHHLVMDGQAGAIQERRAMDGHQAAGMRAVVIRELQAMDVRGEGLRLVMDGRAGAIQVAAIIGPEAGVARHRVTTVRRYNPHGRHSLRYSPPGQHSLRLGQHHRADQRRKAEDKAGQHRRAAEDRVGQRRRADHSLAKVLRNRNKSRVSVNESQRPYVFLLCADRTRDFGSSPL
jgi:hypothetical protein